MLAHFRHDCRRFLIGGLLPGELALVFLTAAAWGTILATQSPRYRAAGPNVLLASAPYSEVMGFVVPVIAVVNCGIRLGLDYTQGIAKYELVGSSRTRVLLTRCAFLAVSLGLLHVSAAVGYAVVPLLTGRVHEVGVEGALQLAGATAVVWTGTLPLLTLLVVAGVVWSSMEVEVVAGLILVAGCSLVNSFAREGWYWLPNALMLRPLAAFTGPQLATAVGVAVIVAVVAGVVACRCFERKDILR